MYGYKMGSMECTENMHMRCTEWYKSTCSTRAVWLVPESERERGRERDRQRERERERGPGECPKCAASLGGV